MRCFLAIELPDVITFALDSAARAVRETDSSWAGEKWVAPDLMHVTLKFLAGVDEEAVDRLADGFGAAASDVTPFELTIAGLHAVPRPARASMIWARIEDPTGRCVELARAVDEAAAALGFEREARRFTPHVTLVRARRPRAVAIDSLAAAFAAGGLSDLESVSVPSVTLFSSVLTPPGTGS